jgi:hypothetical protein
MKRVLISLMFVLMFVMSSCGGEEYSCNYGGQCPNHGGTWDACCTSSDCYYKVIDKTFECDGTDCITAAQELQSYCFESDAERMHREFAEVYCDKVFSCDEMEGMRPHLGGSESSCITIMISYGVECDNINFNKVDECNNCYENMSCSEFVEEMSSEEEACPACEQICND